MLHCHSLLTADLGIIQVPQALKALPDSSALPGTLAVRLGVLLSLPMDLPWAKHLLRCRLSDMYQVKLPPVISAVKPTSSAKR